MGRSLLLRFKNKYINRPFSRADKADYISLIVLSAFFLFKALEYAFSIEIGIAPDEPEHFKIIQLYSTYTFRVEEFPEMYVFGPLTHVPYFYYFLMGKILSLNIFGINDLVFLRLPNIFFSFLTVVFSLKLTALVTKSRLVKLLTVLIITNVPMFSFLSGMINYDNLADLFAVLSIYSLIYFYKYSTRSSFLFFIIFTSFGLITKITMFPLAVISTLIILVILVSRFPKLHELKNTMGKQIRQISLYEKALMIIATFSIMLVINLYGRNIMAYRAILPSCYQVTSYDNCQLNPAVRGEEQLKPPETPIHPYYYFYVWKLHMYDGTFGIFGQQKLFKKPELIIPYEVIINISLLGLAKQISPKKKILLILSIISAFFILVLAYYQNYSSYLASSMTFFAVHGRYLFPVLAPMCILMSYSLMNLFKNHFLKAVIFIMVAIVFLFGDYIYYKRNVPDEWYRKSTIAESFKETNKYYKY